MVKKYQFINWIQIDYLMHFLIHELQKKDFIPDIIIGVFRGGLYSSLVLSDFFSIKDYYILRVKKYSNNESNKIILEPFGSNIIQRIKDKKVLVVDDINDTGETINTVNTYINTLNPSLLKFLVLHNKHRSKATSDFYAMTVPSSDWIIYPWSLYEDLYDLVKMVLKNNKLDLNSLLDKIKISNIFNLKKYISIALQEMQKRNLIEIDENNRWRLKI